MYKSGALPVFLLIVTLTAVGAGQFVGGIWYQEMLQPQWNPPPVLLAVIWPVLYGLMAISAWLVWKETHGFARAAMATWGFQLLLSILWSWAFLGVNRIGWSLAILTLWILVVLLVIKLFRNVLLEASYLMVPVAAWLLFAWALNFVQWHMNGGGISSIFN